MGGCVSARRGSTSASGHGGSELTGVALGRNQPLRRERPKWKSEFPMTEGQLRSKRDEFWDTAPAFEGRKEIWDALRAAAYAFECSDYDLAQAIADGASISLPHGTLTDCYDELGNRYQLPVYCLVPPVNLITEDDGNADDDAAALAASDGESASGREYPLRLRLSTGQDLTLAARTTDTVAQAKRRLCIAEPSLEPTRQRWFFAGRLLADRVVLADLKIPRDFLVQVVVTHVHPPPAPPAPAPTPVEN